MLAGGVAGSVGFYDDIVGAEAFAKTKKGGIAGVETDDKTGLITLDPGLGNTNPISGSQMFFRLTQ